MLLTHPRSWEKLLSRTDSHVRRGAYPNAFAIPEMRAAAVANASWIANSSEFLIEEGYDPLASIAAAAVTSCTVPIGTHGYALQLGKEPLSDKNEAFDMLRDHWLYGDKAEDVRSLHKEVCDITPRSAINATDWYSIIGDNPVVGDRESIWPLPENPQFVDGHLVVDLFDAAMTIRFLRSSVWMRKEIKMLATQATRPTPVETILEDGTVEASNVAQPGDWIVTNPGGEEYVISNDKFPLKCYRDNDDAEGVFRSTSDAYVLNNHFGESVCVETPWQPGEYMTGDENCSFVSPIHSRDVTRDRLLRSSERYIIGGNEKIQTYRPAHFMGNDSVIVRTGCSRNMLGALRAANEYANESSIDPAAEVMYRLHRKHMGENLGVADALQSLRDFFRAVA